MQTEQNTHCSKLNFRVITKAIIIMHKESGVEGLRLEAENTPEVHVLKDVGQRRREAVFTRRKGWRGLSADRMESEAKSGAES